jgi:Domain of unknown function (DUF6434)/SAP domain-containing new25
MLVETKRMKRPEILKITNGKELKKWYWLKQELVDYCKRTKVNYTGTKFEILDRIANKLDRKNTVVKNKKTTHSNFDWHSQALTLNTVITSSYKNSQNVRRFFKQHCGIQFHFSIPFMHYMKTNSGKTLKDAISEWKRLNTLTKDKTFKSNIPSGNQYNQYIRDFFADNKNLSLNDARHFWKLKRSLPLGKHIYEKSDLKLK